MEKYYCGKDNKDNKDKIEIIENINETIN